MRLKRYPRGSRWRSGHQDIVVPEKNGTAANQLRITGGNADVSQWGGTNTITGGAVSSNVWHMVTWTYNSVGTASVIYIDGVQSATAAVATQASAVTAVYIGQYGGGEFFNGDIDDVRIYNRVLSARTWRSFIRTREKMAYSRCCLIKKDHAHQLSAAKNLMLGKRSLKIILFLIALLSGIPPASAAKNFNIKNNGQSFVFVLGTSGNVGISSVNPGQLMDVQGTVRTMGFIMSGQTPIGGYVLTASDSAGDTTWTSGGAVSGWTVSGANVYESLGGNVGIGTTRSPTPR